MSYRDFLETIRRHFRKQLNRDEAPKGQHRLLCSRPLPIVQRVFEVLIPRDAHTSILYVIGAGQRGTIEECVGLDAPYVAGKTLKMNKRHKSSSFGGRKESLIQVLHFH